MNFKKLRLESNLYIIIKFNSGIGIFQLFILAYSKFNEDMKYKLMQLLLICYSTMD